MTRATSAPGSSSRTASPPGRSRSWSAARHGDRCNLPTGVDVVLMHSYYHSSGPRHHRPARRRRRFTRSSNAALRAAIATGRLRPAISSRPCGSWRSISGQRQHRRTRLCRSRARRRARDAPRRRLVRHARRRRRRIRRASTSGAFGRSSPACSPTPTRAGSRSTKCVAALDVQRTPKRRSRWIPCSQSPLGRVRGVAAALNVVAVAILLACVAVGARGARPRRQPGRRSSPCVARSASSLMQSPRIAQQWERAVVLRLGRFVGLRGPGLFWIVPFVDTRLVLDRSAHHHDQLRRRADADLGHGAGQRRRGAVLDGARRRRRRRSKCRTTRRR